MENYKEICTCRTLSGAITLTNQTVAAYNSSESVGIYCRTFRNGHWGMAYGQDMTESGLSRIESRVLRNMQPSFDLPDINNLKKSYAYPPAHLKV